MGQETPWGYNIYGVSIFYRLGVLIWRNQFFDENRFYVQFETKKIILGLNPRFPSLKVTKTAPDISYET